MNWPTRKDLESKTTYRERIIEHDDIRMGGEPLLDRATNLKKRGFYNATWKINEGDNNKFAKVESEDENGGGDSGFRSGRCASAAAVAAGEIADDEISDANDSLAERSRSTFSNNETVLLNSTRSYGSGYASMTTIDTRKKEAVSHAEFNNILFMFFIIGALFCKSTELLLELLKWASRKAANLHSMAFGDANILGAFRLKYRFVILPAICFSILITSGLNLIIRIIEFLLSEAPQTLVGLIKVPGV